MSDDEQNKTHKNVLDMYINNIQEIYMYLEEFHQTLKDCFNDKDNLLFSKKLYAPVKNIKETEKEIEKIKEQFNYYSSRNMFTTKRLKELSKEANMSEEAIVQKIHYTRRLMISTKIGIKLNEKLYTHIDVANNFLNELFLNELFGVENE